ncbi:putative acyltransferase [Anseongella ginsenosidimutans]|uniref:Putative acyltransferase n=1 Tax=Anseongella ginsenosidimutans TaxID=496056 RepID=A0A4R3KQ60_9SPHI|nr:heparan-alpha-glucosaminide N-acetyltransferase domain-containing protein [Anseongella ginsenosidimutans]QEC52770.1 DUF1624 domain-containing protein [Anseongella ginsenosidimutans]TCS85528.1 putative acyltransferase [Anseongella ginsenosidimutans]
METPTTPAKGERLISLDAFRGFTIAAMIIVNDPGGSHHDAYPPLRHADWNGITPTDFIFPFFIFIVGVSIVLSYSPQQARGVPRGKMVGKILKRSAIIFALGVFLNLFPDFNFAEVRLPGVLQRIALAFLACALLFLYTGRRTQAWLSAGILVVYWLLMTLVPVPGYGESLLEPGKNLAAWMDSLLIPGTLYQGTWDPEGILSTFPAIATGITGMLAGHLLISGRTREQKIIWLFFAGLIAYALGNIWNWFFPINKNLWTSSYVLYTSGLAAMTLGAFYFFIDVLGYRKWTKPGLVFGSNAITAYVIAGLLPALLYLSPGGGESINSLFMDGLTGAGLSQPFASLLWALGFCLICYIPVYFLYKKQLFIKV